MLNVIAATLSAMLRFIKKYGLVLEIYILFTASPTTEAYGQQEILIVPDIKTFMGNNSLAQKGATRKCLLIKNEKMKKVRRGGRDH